MAMKKPGIYAPLHAHYFDDTAIMEAGEDAELLYVRMLAYASRQMELEGYLSDRVITSRLGIMPRMEDDGTGIVPGTDAGSRAGTLAGVGLLTRTGSGYRISGWLKWNKSAEEMDKERKRDRARKTNGETAPDEDFSGTDTGTDVGSRTGTDAGKVPGSHAPIQVTTSQSNPLSSSRAVALPEPPRDDIESICNHLATRIHENGAKRPTIGKTWLTEARLLIDRDGRDFQEIHQTIDWCQADSFWKTNILSMPKFREKYDQLLLKSKQPAPRQQQQATLGTTDWDAKMARARALDEADEQARRTA